MRADSLDVADALRAPTKSPRFVVSIQYETSSPHFTSHTGLSNVPGVPVAGVLQNLSGTSQEIHPDEFRSTIGSFSFDVVDVDGAMTDELRDQLSSNDQGPRRLQVRVFMGFSDDFTEFARIATYQLLSVELVDNVYSVSCADIQRELRDEIFTRAKTRLDASLTASATSMTVLDTSDFETMAHTGAFTDAPDSTVGYIRIRKTGEIIRYTGKTSTSFTGLTRGVFSTLAQPVTLSGDEEDDQKPEIEEFIYLEMPAPELTYALLTGVIRSSTSSPQDTLPSGWHLGVDESLVDGDAFDDIGLDLVDPNDDEAGRVMRFTHLEGVDGKRFISEQLLLPMNCFMPIDADGVLGLKRMVRILTDAPYVGELDEDNVISHSSLVHDQDSVINQVQIDWNYNGEEYTRSTLIVDGESINRNGAAHIKKIQLRGIHVSRHSDNIIRQIARSLFDRYGEPPLRIEVEAFSSQSFLEVGDIARLTLDRLRDYQGTSTLDRSFEVQNAQQDWRTGRISLSLFGSAREVPEEQPAGSSAALPDGWYDDAGTELSTVLTISADTVTANGSLTGNADLNNSGAIFYYDGDLTIDSGVTVTISANVQLRIRGTLTINGKIDGAGGGLTGKTNPNDSGSPNVLTHAVANYLADVGYLGTTRSGDGVRALQMAFAGLYTNLFAYPSYQTIGRHSAAPPLNMEVTGTLDSPQNPVLVGLPTDLRGTAGTPGLPVTFQGACEFAGGDGGDSGAGLAIVCRGLAFGVSGEIDLSGGAGSNGENGTVTSTQLYAGSGGGGAPGALYVLLDGNDITFPDLGSNFVANRGATPEPGTPGRLAPETGVHRIIFDAEPGMGAFQGLPADNMADSAHQIQYIPIEAGLGEGADEEVPAPDDLSASVDATGVLLTWTAPPASKYDYIEVFESLDNDRSNSTLKTKIKGDWTFLGSDTEITRYYWIRARDEEKGFSEWEPVSSTGGVEAIYGGAEAAGPMLGGGLIKNGGFETGGTDHWSVGAGGSGFVVSSGNERSETYSARIDLAISASNILFQQVLPTPPDADRLLLIGFAARSGSPNRDLVLRAQFLDSGGASAGLVTIGTASAGTSGYQAIRGIATVPSGAVQVAFRWSKASPHNTDESGRWFVDDCSMHVMPKDPDIDALETTNGPAEADAQDNEGRFDFIVDTGLDAIVSIDDDSQVLAADEADEDTGASASQTYVTLKEFQFWGTGTLAIRVRAEIVGSGSVLTTGKMRVRKNDSSTVGSEQMLGTAVNDFTWEDIAVTPGDSFQVQLAAGETDSTDPAPAHIYLLAMLGYHNRATVT